MTERVSDPTRADVVVIGGGVVGAAIARELARYRLAVVLVEKAPDVGAGTSKANSGILHAGFDCEPGTWKARLNVRGAALYAAISAGLGIARRASGSLVVARTAEQFATLEVLRRRGLANGVPGLEIWDGERTRAHEPNLAADIHGALWAPTAAIVCPFEATVAFAENAVRNGVRLLRDCPVTGIESRDGTVSAVLTSRGRIATAWVVNAAGLFADRVARMAGDDSFAIAPRKGEYILFDKTVQGLVNTVLFPTPDKVSKGILVSPTAHGNTFIGPNAAPTADPDDRETTRDGFAAIIAGARALVPGLPLGAAITGFAGLRADAGHDFVIGPSPALKGLVHAAGIQSPGLTSAPAIGEAIVDILGGLGLPLVAKPEFDPTNPARLRFAHASPAEQAALIADDRLYGRVICRCETVTEAEIVAAIHGPCGARTVDGVKRRTRAGCGRCQGGFCGPRVTDILARELGVPVTAVRKDDVGSELYFPRLAVVGKELADA